MRLDFPIELFDKNPECDLKLKVDVGLKIARDASIKFVGIAKDAAPYIDRNIMLAKYIGEQFNNYSIYIYENDSKDNTVEILNKHNIEFDSEKRPDLAYIRDDSPDIDPYHYKRCLKLVEARNRYTALDYSDYDYVCVVDWDIKGGWWIPGFFVGLTGLKYLPQAGAVGAYGVLGSVCGKIPLEEKTHDFLMYDSFAFRSIDAPEKSYIGDLGRYNFISCKVGDTPMEVKSNFGGITLYHKEVFAGRKYSAKHWSPEQGHVDCDHVCLHRDIRTHGHRIYMDPTFVSSHSPHRYSNG